MTMRRPWILLFVVGFLVASPFIGPSLDGTRGDFVFWSLRLPRVLLGFLVGGTLSLVGAAFQTLFNNPLAAPSTIGTSAGATLGAVVALIWAGSDTVVGLPLVSLSAFAGACLVTLLVAALASSGRAQVHQILLAGIAISLAASAISSGLRYTTDLNTLAQSVLWSLGHLATINYGTVGVVLPFVVLVVVVFFTQIRAFEALSVDADRARSQGVDVRFVRALTLGVGSLGVGASVAACGPIAFVGLIVPHIVRLAFGASQRILIPLSFVIGGAFLVLCDVVARTAFSGREFPVGIVTAGLGAPAMIWLISRAGRR